MSPAPGTRCARCSATSNCSRFEEDRAVCAECDNAAERLLLAVGGVSMGRVAGQRFCRYLYCRIT
jgi:hypothetical protein